ncbi:hypothetical protein FF1_041803 [Malus domestica]
MSISVLRSITCVLMAAAASSSSSDSHGKYEFLNFRGLEAAASSSSAISTKLWNRKQLTPSLTPKSLKKPMTFRSSWQLSATQRLSILFFFRKPCFFDVVTWCLKELVQKCMDAHKQIVVPVFYEVDPSDIRKLKGSFAEAFAKHERDSNAGVKEVQSWRSALASSWDSHNYKFNFFSHALAIKVCLLYKYHN